jgi:hypothetical protein
VNKYSGIIAVQGIRGRLMGIDLGIAIMCGNLWDGIKHRVEHPILTKLFDRGYFILNTMESYIRRG